MTTVFVKPIGKSEVKGSTIAQGTFFVATLQGYSENPRLFFRGYDEISVIDRIKADSWGLEAVFNNVRFVKHIVEFE